MPQRPAAPGPGRDGDPGRAEEDWLAWCEAVEEQLGPDEDDPEDAAPWDVDIDALIAECREITAEEAACAARAARLGLPGGTPIAEGRRGPGQPGSGVRRPGEFGSRAAGFGAGMALDVMPGCGALAGFAAEAAGEDDRYAGACDDEVAGAVAAWDRVEAYAAARKHAAVAEFIRRRPRPGSPLEGPAQLPESWDESITAEVAAVLAESRSAADAMLDLAHDLEVKLPGTAAAFRDGILRQSKVAIIVRATAVLDAAEARAAEHLVLDRAGQLTPGALRAAIARAVMEVAPKKARKRREVAAKFARVERWAEDSGNAALMGRELASDEVLAADQRITAWAQELKKAGLEGDMDVLRARAYLDLLLGSAGPHRPVGSTPPNRPGTRYRRQPGKLNAFKSPRPRRVGSMDYPPSIVPVNHVAPVPRRIRAYLGAEKVLDTTRALYVWEWPHYPQYYIPLDDVRRDVLVSEGHTQQTGRGLAELHGLEAGEAHRPRAARVITDSAIEGLKGTVRFEWAALDAWFEEDEQVFVHPRDPYSRVDALRSNRRVRVELDGVVLADSASPVMVFETGLPVRYYVNRTDVRFEHLVPSDTVTSCPYKGMTSGYWSVRVGGTVHKDLAWAYDFPTRQLLPIAGLVAFYNEMVDTYIDGEPLDRPQTHFSRTGRDGS